MLPWKRRLINLFFRVCNFCVFINENYLLCSYFRIFRSFLHGLIFFFLSVIFGRFLTFWKKFEVQDGGFLDIMK